MKLEISDTIVLVLIIVLAIAVVILIGLVVYYKIEKYYREKVTQTIVGKELPVVLGAKKPEKAGLKQSQTIITPKATISQWTSQQMEAIDSGNMKIEFLPGKNKGGMKSGHAFTMTTTSRMQFLNSENQFTESDVNAIAGNSIPKLDLDDTQTKSTKRIERPTVENSHLGSTVSVRNNESKVQNTIEDIRNFKFEDEGSVDPESLDKSATSVRTPKLITANMDFKHEDKKSGTFKIWEHTVNTSEAFKLKSGGFM
jgi:hypothetical protein